MVINQSNVPYLLTNLRKHSIRCHLNSMPSSNSAKQDVLKEAFASYLSLAENQIYRKAIQDSALYDNGKFTGLISRFQDDI